MACKYQAAVDLHPWDYYSVYCVEDRDLDWCAWSCREAHIKKDTRAPWYHPHQLEFACDPSWEEDRKSIRSTEIAEAKVSLAREGFQVE